MVVSHTTYKEAPPKHSSHPDNHVEDELHPRDRVLAGDEAPILLGEQAAPRYDAKCHVIT